MNDREFIIAGLSMVCNGLDSALAERYFAAAERAGIVIRNDERYDYVINGIRYQLVK